MNARLQLLSKELEGELYYDRTMRILYATDASAYREMPLAVAIPKSIADHSTHHRPVCRGSLRTKK